MADESRSSDTNERTGGVTIGDVEGGIRDSTIAGGDVNITLIINELKTQAPLGDKTDEVRRQAMELYKATIQLLSRSLSELSEQSTTLSPGELDQRLEDSLWLTRRSRQLWRAKEFLGDFSVSPQAMMITEPVTFVFGGEIGERQAAIHIARALREKKIRVNFRGTGSYSRINAMVERDPSFPSGPLKVVVPAGTCISPEAGGMIEFPSFVLPQQELERGHVVRKD